MKIPNKQINISITITSVSNWQKFSLGPEIPARHRNCSLATEGGTGLSAVVQETGSYRFGGCRQEPSTGGLRQEPSTAVNCPVNATSKERAAWQPVPERRREVTWGRRPHVLRWDFSIRTQDERRAKEAKCFQGRENRIWG